MLSPIERFRRITKTQKISLVIAIASAFLVLEVIVGFLTRSLVLVADAFHILSDIIGYIVALVAVKYAKRPAGSSEQYTYGFRRAETLGGFFNGAFLMALGVSVLLQSIERFIEPSHLTDPVLVMAVGAAGIGSNILMLLILGGHGHGGQSHEHENDTHTHGEAPSASHSHSHELQNDPQAHEGHAHVRAGQNQNGKRSSRFSDVNILGVLIHILGDALNSLAVIISAGIFKATGFVYADPIASVLVGGMIIGTAWPLIVRSGRSLLDAAPDAIDIKGVTEDVERITGKGSVHDLHVWSVDGKNAIASLHLLQSEDSLKGFDALSEDIRKCLHLWGIHNVTIQPEHSIPPSYSQPQNTSPPSSTNAIPSVQAIIGGPGRSSQVDLFTRQCKRQCTDTCEVPLVL